MVSSDSGSCAVVAVHERRRAVNVLVLGATVFLGRHLVAELLGRGHDVTTFNRGTHAVAADLARIAPGPPVCAAARSPRP